VYDYYKILEVPRNANSEDIRRAYRNKAKLVHPDVNDSPKAQEVFVVVTEAYEVLMDEQKRYMHDIKLNYIDTAREEAERKKQYYGSSVKNDTYTNFNHDWSNFEKVAYKEKTDEEYFNRSPFFYNLFFASGMLIGFIIISVTLIGTFRHLWPFPFILISVTGFILVKEGWKGIMKKKSLLFFFLRVFRKKERV